jgi:hypothetical protein
MHCLFLFKNFSPFDGHLCLRSSSPFIVPMQYKAGAITVGIILNYAQFPQHLTFFSDNKVSIDSI